MRRAIVMGALGLLGCGLEDVIGNLGHNDYDRPASIITGTVPDGTTLDQISIIDGDDTVLTPFLSKLTGTTYELRLPSSTYKMLRVRVDIGNVELRTIVPLVDKFSSVSGVDVDARSTAETLIAEARLSADGDSMRQVTPEAYLGTRTLIQAGLDEAGSPAQQLFTMMQAFMTKLDKTQSVSSPDFFKEATFVDATYKVKQSAIDPSFILRNPFDYVGDGKSRSSSADFDTQLATVAKLYRPAGCPDPDRIRLVFTVDFNATAKSGNCSMVNRFVWATDKAGKSMFFVGWIYDGSAGLTASDISDPTTAKAMGSSSPNTIPMHDDGTNGDQTAGDNIWTIYFDVPRSSPGHVLRIGYKYTWGTPGAGWGGSEEWPGNSRILEVVDDNNDNFVYRHDTFTDEATNKDKANLSQSALNHGSIDWTTAFHDCGPEAHENRYDNNTCTCAASVPTPKWVGPLTVTCTQ